MGQIEQLPILNSNKGRIIPSQRQQILKKKMHRYLFGGSPSQCTLKTVEAASLGEFVSIFGLFFEVALHKSPGWPCDREQPDSLLPFMRQYLWLPLALKL